MTYPPGSPGYPPAQQPTTQFAAPTQQFGKPDTGPVAAEGPNKLPLYLTAAVAALGLIAFLASFGPLFTSGSGGGMPEFGEQTLTGGALLSSGGGIPLIVVLFAALLAGVALLPKQPSRVGIVAALAVLGFLLTLLQLIGKPGGVSAGWGLLTIVVVAGLQAIIAVAVLLFDAGVITPPAPKPKYEQQYGQYGAPGQYYGQPQGQLQHHGGPQHQQGPQQQQRQGYPPQYGGYQGGQPSGGYSGGQQSGPPTPPTGFPTYGQPPGSSAPTSQVPSQPQSPSSSQSGPAPS
jgi:hypothetical protein